MRRRRLLAASGGALLIPAARAAGAGAVTVLYAGSLVRLMETGLFPAFARAGDGRPIGYAAGSTGIANELRGGLRRGDVFVSASPKADALLAPPNPNPLVRWWVAFARSPLVLGAMPNGPAAAALRSGQPWTAVLADKRFRLGRSDPALDPKGALTVELLRRAERQYREPGLAARVLGPPENPAQVFPEPELVGRLQSGQIDIGFFYSLETTALGIAAFTLPEAIDPAAHYTATVPANAANPVGGTRFVAFLLGDAAATAFRAQGVERLLPPVLSGDPGAAPAIVRAAIAG